MRESITSKWVLQKGIEFTVGALLMICGGTFMGSMIYLMLGGSF